MPAAVPPGPEDGPSADPIEDEKEETVPVEDTAGDALQSRLTALVDIFANSLALVDEESSERIKMRRAFKRSGYLTKIKSDLPQWAQDNMWRRDVGFAKRKSLVAKLLTDVKIEGLDNWKTKVESELRKEKYRWIFEGDDGDDVSTDFRSTTTRKPDAIFEH